MDLTVHLSKFQFGFQKQMVIFLILLFKNQVLGIFNGQRPLFKSPLKNDASRSILLFRATLEHWLNTDRRVSPTEYPLLLPVSPVGGVFLLRFSIKVPNLLNLKDHIIPLFTRLSFLLL